jgi:hypothetical protein
VTTSDIDNDRYPYTGALHDAARRPLGHSVGKPCRENYVAKLGSHDRLRYSQGMAATQLVTAAGYRPGQPRPGRPYAPPARRAGSA